MLQCAVIVREDSPDDKRLVAYLVPKESGTEERELKEYLATRLPEYVVLNIYVVLRTLPQTPNKKVDRKALPRPDAAVGTASGTRLTQGNGAAPKISGPKQAPAEGLERSIATIWTELLAKGLGSLRPVTSATLSRAPARGSIPRSVAMKRIAMTASIRP